MINSVKSGAPGKAWRVYLAERCQTCQLLVQHVVAASRERVTEPGKQAGPEGVRRPGEGGESPPDDEGASPNASEPDSASLHRWQWPTFQTRRSLLLVGRKRAQLLTGLPGVIEGGAFRKTRQGTWETRQPGWNPKRRARNHKCGMRVVGSRRGP